MSALQLAKYSLGVGDRFAHQARAQLQACIRAGADGVIVVPVWNKSHREHTIVRSEPAGVRRAADEAVKALGWIHSYHCDADHIGLGTVDRFLDSSDFFTIDVADAIGRAPAAGAVDRFVSRHAEAVGRPEISGIERSLDVTPDLARAAASRYLCAIEEAGRIYRHIESRKGRGAFITEVSMDETSLPQTPAELLLILAAVADEGIPIQTIAPKFTGRFNKGVEYAGNLEQFEQEFADDLAVITHAVRVYGLPDNLKLSIHSGSDKFSIYPSVSRSLKTFDAGVHLKTAGTTWLEELIGLAEAGGDGLDLVKDIYQGAFERAAELCAPYASVIDIDASRLPSPAAVRAWSAERYASALRHDRANPDFNPDLRQLLHVGYKIAVSIGDRYTKQLVACEAAIARNVTENLYARHIRPIFLEAVGSSSPFGRVL